MKKINIIIVIIAILAIVGYIKNIVKLTRLDFKAPYKAEVIRVASIPLGIGAITGWINIKDN